MIKRIFVDTETTSVNRLTCGLWQIGGIIQAGKRVEEFQFECDIFREDDVSQEALDLHGLTMEMLSAKPDPIQVNGQFQELLGKYVDKYDRFDKFFFINFGAEFDSEVIRQWFEKCGDDFYGSWFWHPPIDLMPLAMHYLMKKRSDMRNFKLHSVLEALNIPFETDKLHGALYDGKAAMELYYTIIGQQ